MVLNNNSFIIYSTTFFSWKLPIIASLFKSLNLYVQELAFNTESVTNIFWSVFGVIVAKNILVLCYPESIITFKFSSYWIQFLQSKWNNQHEQAISQYNDDKYYSIHLLTYSNKQDKICYFSCHFFYRFYLSKFL